MTLAFLKALFAALWFETGGLFDPSDPACVNGTDRRKCGTSGGVNDHGGNTKFGIAKNSHPDVDIDSLTLAQAAKIYWEEYWLPCQCDKLPDNVGAYVFDIACGSGDKVAEKMLQRAVGVVADGQIGPVTLAAVNSKPADQIVEALRIQRIAYYHGIIDHDPSQGIFFNGWSRRANTYLARTEAYNDVTLT